MPEFTSNMQIICLESDAFKALLKEVANQIKQEEMFQFDPWVDEKEAMQLLKIASKTTFQKYRDDGKIDFRRISSKHIVYRRQSILDFIENSTKSENDE
ncbi:MAG: helix-turn-helix domain-containing protein [Saprospiraceae bacterium]|nr:helix-turn-helix domain-containing protein [Saprospiraceae bacterium]MCB9322939.1 helix-turn-helix domain-containing protein [Lewinellaceae bacterium]